MALASGDPACASTRRSVGHRLLVGDHDEERGRDSTPRELALDGVDDLSFVQLLASQTRDAFPLLHKPKQWSLLKEARDLHEVIHEVAIQTRDRGDQNVILNTDLQLVECQIFRSLPFPGRLLDEFEEGVVKGRQAARRFGCERNRSANFRRLITQLHHERVGWQLVSQCAERDSTTSARPRRQQLHVGPDIGIGEFGQCLQPRGALWHRRHPIRHDRPQRGLECSDQVGCACGQRTQQHLTMLVQHVEQAEKRRRVWRSNVGDAGLREGEVQNDLVLQFVIRDRGHGRRAPRSGTE